MLNTKQLFKFGTVPALYPLLSIHAPRAGCDRCRGYATHDAGLYFNPRTPCGVRLRAAESNNQHRHISIHAPRAGCDFLLRLVFQPLKLFQSTHPVRGATPKIDTDRCIEGISIHAPRAGCDPGQIGTAIYQDSDFNPRTPCGVRPSSCGAAPVDGVFQSTHPVRGATRPCRGAPESRLSISIHAPRAGCDKKTKAATIILLISIHAPRAGCDDVLTGDVSFENVFQSTHPVRGATCVPLSDRLPDIGRDIPVFAECR